MRFLKDATFLHRVGISALICLITFLLLFISEIGVRFFAPQLDRRLVSNGVSGMKPDAELRYVLAPNYHALKYNPEFNPPVVEYRTNAQGLRDHRIYGERKSPDTVRVLVLGDSFTYGVATNYSQIWPVVFEQELTKRNHKVEVIKAGIFGYDTAQEILYLKRLYPQYKPDIVIFGFLVNDLFTNGPLSANGAEPKKQFEEASVIRANLAAQKADNLHLLVLAKRLLLKSDTLYTNIYLKTHRGKFFDLNSPMLQRQLDITKKLLLEASSYAAQNSFKFAVLSIPQAFQIINTDKSIDVTLVDKELEEFAKKTNFVWISSLPVFLDSYAREQEDLHYRLDGHLNTKGNRLIGDFLADRFADVLGSKLSSGE